MYLSISTIMIASCIMKFIIAYLINPRTPSKDMSVNLMSTLFFLFQSCNLYFFHIITKNDVCRVNICCRHIEISLLFYLKT